MGGRAVKLGDGELETTEGEYPVGRAEVGDDSAHPTSNGVVRTRIR